MFQQGDETLSRHCHRCSLPPTCPQHDRKIKITRSQTTRPASLRPAMGTHHSYQNTALFRRRRGGSTRLRSRLLDIGNRRRPSCSMYQSLLYTTRYSTPDLEYKALRYTHSESPCHRPQSTGPGWRIEEYGNRSQLAESPRHCRLCTEDRPSKGCRGYPPQQRMSHRRWCRLP
jgi:hypothetical protein